jgi:hypothetical protein
MIRTLSLVVTALALSAGAAPSASAKVAVGVGEQDYPPFSDAAWTTAGLKKSRFVTPWNVATTRGFERDKMDNYYRAARANRVELLVAFNPSAGSRCPRRPCRLPSARSYTRAFRSFRRRYPRLKVIAPWNEANHVTQPTHRNPRAAAKYYNIVRKYCRGCKIIAADVIDETNMSRWLRSFRRVARRPGIWGLHNYRDTNPRRGQKLGGTRRLLRTVRRGQVWLTETGGIVTFQLASGRTLFPTNETRADAATRRMFSLAKNNRRRITRLYIYHWRQSTAANRFDAGLIRANGTPRPAYNTVLSMLNGSQRRYFGR